MTAALFKEWCEKQLFPNLEQGTVIVLELVNAPTYFRLSERILNSIVGKSDIVQFLQIHNVATLAEQQHFVFHKNIYAQWP